MKDTTRARAIVLLSGGMDSVAALHWALATYTEVVAIGFDYGQPNRDAEIPIAWRIARDLVFHALGNADPRQLEHYPMASFDSTGWQRDAGYSASKPWPLNRVPADLRMQCYIEATETIAHRPLARRRMQQATLPGVT